MSTNPKDVAHIKDQMTRASVEMITATSQLQQDSQAVRADRPNWRAYLQSQIISQEDFNVISAFESAESEKRKQILSNPEHSVQVAQTLINIMSNVSKVNTVRYILTLIDDLLFEDNERVKMFWGLGKKLKQQPWTPFLAMLTRDDGFVVNQTSRILAKLACWSGPDNLMSGNDLTTYFSFLKDQLRAPNNTYIQTSARCLQMLLRVDKYRMVFYQLEGVPTIMTILSGKANFQLQYQLTFCLWCLTFNEQLATKMQRHGVVPVLSDMLSESAKEKVHRIILAVFRNLLDKVSDPQVLRDNALQMVQNKVLKQLEIMSSRKYDDEEITADIEYLSDKLHTNVADLSSMDEYEVELRSGRLTWSPVHKSDKFWYENASKFNEKNFELVKMLIHIVETSNDPLVLAVAAHDIGEYVRHYPRGKTVLEQLHGKTQVMKLLTHADPNVRYHALLAVQKLMVHNWEYLGKQIEESKDDKNKSTPAIKGKA